jgi:high-affinity nickel-transport protein
MKWEKNYEEGRERRFNIVEWWTHAQPSVRRGAILLLGLIVLNILVLIATILLSAHYSFLSGLAFLAWGFGVRHAMDADHIAAIDNVTRRLLYRGHHSVGVGTYFSLGHSTIVLLLTILILFFAPSMGAHSASWKETGALIGASISSLFLLFVAIVNTAVLVKLIRAWSALKSGKENIYHGHMHIGGPIEKIFRPLLKLIDHSYKMYFVGFLFGLGFDTATEVGLLAISAVAVTNIPPVALLILPLAFMAGMTLLDTINALCMLGIYTWSVVDDKRRILYNITITVLSTASALIIGLTVGLRLLAEYFGLNSEIFVLAKHVTLNNVGYGLLCLYIASWIIMFFVLRQGAAADSQVSQ